MFKTITLIDFRKPIAQRKRRYTGPYRWTPAKPGSGRGFYSRSLDMLSVDPAGSTFRLRFDLANEHLGGRLSRINGYYADSFQYFTFHPIVARLPKRRGFLAGYSAGPGMCAALDATIYATAEDAAHAAHSMAEHDAEINRESEEDAEDAAA
jgi:hypothetical protein